ncbi:MAG: membrane dipeptidase [Acidobacteria bacterium]|nr:membrane dipeptidase [Acidobacteriota bacterium]
MARVLAEHPPIDLHADTPSLMRVGYDFLRRHRPPLPRAALGYHVDLPRLRDGGFGGIFLGLVTSPIRFGDRVASVERQISLVESAARRSGGGLVAAASPGAFAAAPGRGAVAYAFGLEGAHALEGRLDPLDGWARRGLRYLTVTHFSRNRAGTPRVGLGMRPDDGLTGWGRALVEACESSRILVDVAHASVRTRADVLAVASAPVIVSHGGVAAVHPMWRNLDDDAVRAVARTGGVAGVIYGTQFLGGDTADVVAAHLEHLWRAGGEDLPALGSDWDGLIFMPRDLRDPTQIGNLVAALLDRRIPERIVGKMLRDNVLRVFDRPVGD